MITVNRMSIHPTIDVSTKASVCGMILEDIGSRWAYHTTWNMIANPKMIVSSSEWHLVHL